MTGDDDTMADVPSPPTLADDRRRARLAQIEAEQEHGRQLAERYGREDPRPRFAQVGHADAKRRRRR